MGWFTRNKVKRSSSGSEPPPSFLDPPNVYAPRPSPPQKPPGRPPTTAAPAPLPYRYPPQYHGQSLQPPSLPYSQHSASQSQPHFQPAGYLPPPPGWNPQPSYQPVIVNQNHYYLGGQSAPEPRPQHHGSSSLGRFSHSMVNLANHVVPGNLVPQLYDEGRAAWHGYGNQLTRETGAMYDEVYNRLNDVMTLIDGEKMSGNEQRLFDLEAAAPAQLPPPTSQSPPAITERGLGRASKKSSKKKPKHQQSSNNVASCVVTGAYFSKVELYANSKLPKNLPPLILYVPTWPLLCLAAQYSQRVYEKARGAESDAHVSSDWRTGTKAMCIKSVPMDTMNTIVFAIRGTATFMDWAVNLKTEPASPRNFLDDAGNLCHAGFLSVARKMIKPVAARLRQLLQEDSRRSNYSLMITGHSAGGAVAALLYCHMLAVTREAQSELNNMTGCFKRIHCVTFGAPPVSLLPLMKPDRPELRKSLFLSFVNEGDPVVRADKAYVRSLIDLLTSPPPPPSRPKPSKDKKSSGGPRKSSSKATLALPLPLPSTQSFPSRPPKPTWPVPPCTLSNAGRLIVLRSGDPRSKIKDRKTVPERLDEGVVAVTCRDEDLRSMIWGDPVCHLMNLYAGRIEVLAVGSVTATVKRR